MAPVVSIPANNKLGPEKPKKPVERKSELICRVKYSNTLPDIPFDPKFISYPFDTNRFVQYKQTSLEKNFKHDLLTELDLGVNIDLINPDTYEPPEQGILKIDEEDDRLLEDEVTAPTDTKRSRCHNRTVTWLKKTEYIATEFNRYGTSNEKTETKVGFGVKKKMDMIDYVGRDGQISAVSRTFEAAKKPIVAHPEKPGVKPVEIIPVFPDFDLWKYPFAQVMFDAEPYKSEEYMSEAVLRGQTGDNVVMYFVPTEATLEKRKKDEEEGRDYIWEEEYEYIKAHEYNCKITNTHTHNKKELIENYFFIWRDNEVVYNELETRINLTKRRVKQASQGVSLLAIKHRELNETEDSCFLTRLEKIEPKKKKEEIEAEEKAKAEKGKDEREKEEDVEMKDADEERGAHNEEEDEDEDDGLDSVNSDDDKSSSEKDDKSDESEDESDSEAEVYRKKKGSEQHSSKSRVQPKSPVKSDSEKSSSSAASSAASASSSSSSESEGGLPASSSDDDENGGDSQRQRQREQKKKGNKKITDIFGDSGSDSGSDNDSD